MMCISYFVANLLDFTVTRSPTPVVQVRDEEEPASQSFPSHTSNQSLPVISQSSPVTSRSATPHTSNQSSPVASRASTPHTFNQSSPVASRPSTPHTSNQSSPLPHSPSPPEDGAQKGVYGEWLLLCEKAHIEYASRLKSYLHIPRN